jgi:Anti-sigma-28 factor, FlgM
MALNECRMWARPVERLTWPADTEATLKRQSVPKAGGTGAVRLNEIQQQVGRGDYQVDTQAVADAIVRRLLHGQLSPEDPTQAQSECS